MDKGFSFDVIPFYVLLNDDEVLDTFSRPPGPEKPSKGKRQGKVFN